MPSPHFRPTLLAKLVFSISSFLPNPPSVYGVRPKTTWHLKPKWEYNLWEFVVSLVSWIVGCPFFSAQPISDLPFRMTNQSLLLPLSTFLTAHYSIILTGYLSRLSLSEKRPKSSSSWSSSLQTHLAREPLHFPIRCSSIGSSLCLELLRSWWVEQRGESDVASSSFPILSSPSPLHLSLFLFASAHPFTDYKMHWAPAMLMYHLFFINYARRLIARLHDFMAEYGCFDEQNRGRDMIDDRHVNQLGRSIYIYTVFRTMGPFILGWKGEMVNPLEGLSLMTPVKLGLWHIALDFWFYLYHRSCHEFDFIWFIHRQHHATKVSQRELSLRMPARNKLRRDRWSLNLLLSLTAPNTNSLYLRWRLARTFGNLHHSFLGYRRCTKALIPRTLVDHLLHSLRRSSRSLWVSFKRWFESLTQSFWVDGSREEAVVIVRKQGRHGKLSSPTSLTHLLSYFLLLSSQYSCWLASSDLGPYP